MDRICDIIIKKIAGRLTPEEERVLQEWASDNERRQRFLSTVVDPRVMTEEYKVDANVNWRRPSDEMRRRVGKIRRRIIVRRVSTAAVIAAVIGTVAWLGLSDTGRFKSPTSGKLAQETSVNDRSGGIVPGQPGAVIHTSDGEMISLNASDTAKVSHNLLGMEKPKKVKSLSLEVARGREFKIVLEDSTVVWLNSESVLYYPETFSADSRRVSVVGEAYFEVKKDVSRPFYVTTGDQQIKVYGTSFNVRGYADEKAIYTTLESGSVAVSKVGGNKPELMLTPGHQSIFDKDDSGVTVKSVDSKVVTGWRHGKFVFEESTLETIMKDLSRWYDFEYEFSDPSLREIVFMGSVSRYTDFRKVISILEDTQEVRFRIDGSKVKIISGKNKN